MSVEFVVFALLCIHVTNLNSIISGTSQKERLIDGELDHS